MMRWMAHMEHTEENRNSHRVLVVKPEGKRQLGVDGENTKNSFL